MVENGKPGEKPKRQSKGKRRNLPGDNIGNLPPLGPLMGPPIDSAPDVTPPIASAPPTESTKHYGGVGEGTSKKPWESRRGWAKRLIKAGLSKEEIRRIMGE